MWTQIRRTKTKKKDVKDIKITESSSSCILLFKHNYPICIFSTYRTLLDTQQAPAQLVNSHHHLNLTSDGFFVLQLHGILLVGIIFAELQALA